LLTRAQLDGRTNAAKEFDQLVVDIENDLGGRNQLSTIKRALVEAFAGAALPLSHLNATLALGEALDLSAHSQAVIAMVRIASRLGLQRRARDVSEMTLAQYLASAPSPSDVLGTEMDSDIAESEFSDTEAAGSKTRTARSAVRPANRLLKPTLPTTTI